jgi:oligopeptide transport system substrate-binding protein
LKRAFLLSCAFFLSACSSGQTTADVTQTFRMAIASEPPTLDWTLATDNVSIRVIENLMEGLASYDQDLKPIPAVARRWEVSPDGKTYTFFLRGDVRWTDGRPVTASDFEYAWKRLLDPKTGAEYAYFLYDVLNAYEFNSGKLKDPDQVGVRAISSDVLQVRLKKAVVYFPSIVTFVVTFPLRKDVVERYGNHWTDPEHMVTDGPFVLESWQHEYQVTLRANEHYFGGRPRLDRIRMFVVPEGTTALTLYDTGDLDMVSLPPVAIPFYQSQKEYLHAPFLRGYYYGFNVRKRPFDDVRIRRAFSLGIDRSEFPLILKGGELPATSWIPPGMFGFQPGIGLSFDPVKAKALLREAGYPDGKDFPSVEAAFNSSPENQIIAENLQEQWKRNLGVKITLNNQDWKVYLKALQVDPPPLFRLGWGADFPDPDNFMNLFTAISGNNHTRWENPQYDSLVDQAAKEPDPHRRQKLYDVAQRILTETDVPMMPLFVAAQNRLIKPYVKGLKLNAMDNLYLKVVWMER